MVLFPAAGAGGGRGGGGGGAAAGGAGQGGGGRAAGGGEPVEAGEGGGERVRAQRRDDTRQDREGGVAVRGVEGGEQDVGGEGEGHGGADCMTDRLMMALVDGHLPSIEGNFIICILFIYFYM